MSARSPQAPPLSGSGAGRPPEPPSFRGSTAADARLLTAYTEACAESAAAMPPPAERSAAERGSADRIEQAARRARHAFLQAHAGHLYDELTDGRTRRPRLDELAFAAAEHYPGLVPDRAQVAADRRLPQAEKSGGEIDQGILFAHLLDRRETGEHLLRSMLAPTPRALDLLPEFRRTGRTDLGQATVHRDGCVAEVTICNQDVLNAEDDAVVEALETAVDLALLDESVTVGVLRGSVLSHPRYRGRRAFGAGINLTHLYTGRISFVDFMLRRELGYIRKLIHGLHHGAADDPFLLPGGKPWVGAVDTFAIGGSTQVALVLDRVIADTDAYFSLPALAEGIIPGAANLRLGRVVGRRMAERLIFFGEKVRATSPEARALCDEVVAPVALDAAVAASAERLADPAVPANRRMLHLAEESDDVFRTYMSRYALEQSARMHSPDVVAKLERTWINRRPTGTRAG
ncbi:(3,5-dihydroxyphenyl)acetyl-CoA 1,2-dioxygenase DpgC [Streptomyces sp. WAC06614]|uniref:(3,5-dihydroxyphenyl)acetyl-CoA 1,2-dioxygenase DpgC n=1 Tax=Streptomyces sp. WAC06614 TaxID=2487416 RepID=UPI000F791B5F|nr:(3,5-dihydroxyphenyl)acetyl-CoA 1,2-dioxygenase DpgC [Streptomyces sp. WAC06614]RSS82223.1 enoyl-CoA hydratase/isomerase family protein [Streptomyces sp. WAC06614]